MEHELEIKRLKEQETVEKKAKGIALKTTMEHDTSEEEKNSEHDGTLSLLTKKFSRFLKERTETELNKEKGTQNPMTQILLVILALVVANQVT